MSKPAAKKAGPAGKASRPSASPRKAAAPRKAAPSTQHISPEEAVAHIQALLDAKQKRTRQASGRPADGQSQPHGESAIHTPESPQLPTDAPKTTIPVHTGQRGAKI
ncbi:hypothetical protein ACFWZ3_03515 [Frateuria sp. GZRR35]